MPSRPVQCWSQNVLRGGDGDWQRRLMMGLVTGDSPARLRRLRRTEIQKLSENQQRHAQRRGWKASRSSPAAVPQSRDKCHRFGGWQLADRSDHQQRHHNAAQLDPKAIKTPKIPFNQLHPRQPKPPAARQHARRRSRPPAPPLTLCRATLAPAQRGDEDRQEQRCPRKAQRCHKPARPGSLQQSAAVAFRLASREPAAHSLPRQ